VVGAIRSISGKKIEESGKAYLTPQMGAMNYLGLNTYEPPFKDVRVRQAVNYALNRELINKALFNGQGDSFAPARSVLAPSAAIQVSNPIL